MMKKKKPILIVLGIILLILLVLFFVFSRTTPTEEGEGSALRRFFTFGTRTNQQGTGNETGGDLLNGGINPLTGREYTDEELRLLRQDQERINREQSTTFTGQQPINPFDINRNGTNFDGTGGFGDSDGGGSDTREPNTPIQPPRPPVPPSGPLCSDVDLYITFTEDEQREIARLQQRFNAIAENIVSDQDVQTEEQNYNTFVLRTERFVELGEMCTGNITKAKASGSVFATLRVPTPFWTESDTPRSFIASSLQRTSVRVSCGDGFETGPLSAFVCTRNVYTLPAIDPTYEKQDTDTWGIPFSWFETFYRIYIW